MLVSGGAVQCSTRVRRGTCHAEFGCSDTQALSPCHWQDCYGRVADLGGRSANLTARFKPLSAGLLRAARTLIRHTLTWQ
jgi:hypothetical protein